MATAMSSRRGAEPGWKMAARASTPVDQAGTGSDEGGVGVHGPHRDAGRQVATFDQLGGQLTGPLQAESTRGDHDDIGPGGGHLIPGGRG